MTIDELEAEVRGLSYEDSLEFFGRFGLGKAAKMHYAKIRIHDLVGIDRINPRAVIVYGDGSDESIDIIESVRENAASIAHPAILLAIHRWEQIIRYRRRFRGNEAYFDNFLRKPLKLRSDENVLAIAERHLERIWDALREGVKKRALTKEEVFVLAVSDLGIDKEYLYLRLATEILATGKIQKMREETPTKLAEMRKKLERYGPEYLVSDYFLPEDIEPSKLKEIRNKCLINPVIDFLDDPSGGRPYLSKKITLASRSQFTKLVRPGAALKDDPPERDQKWREIVNRFDAWRFGLTPRTVKSYRSNAEIQAKEQRSKIEFPSDEWMSPGNNLGDSTEKKNVGVVDFFTDEISDMGRCEEALVYRYSGPRQPFYATLDESSLVPDDPKEYLFDDISRELAVPKAVYPGSLEPVDSFFQTILTWLDLPTVSSQDK